MLAALLLLAAAPLAMRQPPAVTPGIAAMPRVATPRSTAERRINAAVERLDARVRRATLACRADGANPTSWERRVSVPMRGPAFLGYVIEDEVDCGGAHPSEGHAAIVYDLATGAPVAWPALLSPELAGRLALTQGMDGVGVVTLDSPRLRALYATRYDTAARAAGVPGECLGDIEAFTQPMLAWLDARAHALMLRFDLNHAMQACSVAVAIPAAVLRREGASVRLIRALTGAGR